MLSDAPQFLYALRGACGSPGDDTAGSERALEWSRPGCHRVPFGPSPLIAVDGTSAPQRKEKHRVDRPERAMLRASYIDDEGRRAGAGDHRRGRLRLASDWQPTRRVLIEG